MRFTKDVLKIDAGQVTEELCEAIRRQIRSELRKTGAVIGISGGKQFHGAPARNAVTAVWTCWVPIIYAFSGI